MWIILWDCGCVCRCGIAWATELELEHHLREEMTHLAGDVYLSWEGQNPPALEDINAWRRITLPQNT